MIDKKIGAIIRARRKELGINQTQLAERMGITFQQVQKYENGKNALSASRLVQAGIALQIPVARFFSDSCSDAAGNASDREALELMKAFNSIKSYTLRKRISDLARAIAG